MVSGHNVTVPALLLGALATAVLVMMATAAGASVDALIARYERDRAMTALARALAWIEDGRGSVTLEGSAEDTTRAPE
jgi:hypothetical protein